jgi:hypothetical protein
MDQTSTMMRVAVASAESRPSISFHQADRMALTALAMCREGLLSGRALARGQRAADDPGVAARGEGRPFPMVPTEEVLPGGQRKGDGIPALPVPLVDGGVARERIESDDQGIGAGMSSDRRIAVIEELHKCKGSP